MKILFYSGAYSSDQFDALQRYSKVPLQIAANVHQWAIINGLEDNNADYYILNTPFLPSYPMRYEKAISPKGDFIVKGKKRGVIIRYCTFFLLKRYSLEKSLRQNTLKWCEDNKEEEKLIILIYTQDISFLKASLYAKKKYRNIVIATIVADLTELAMSYKSNRSLLKRFQLYFELNKERKLLPKVDKFVLLTKHMEDILTSSIGHSIVIEGIYGGDDIRRNEINKDPDIRTLFYSGTLEEFSGIKLLIDAFMLTKNKNFQLVIYGSGTCESYIKQKSLEDQRIAFRGVVKRAEILNAQQTACLLVNPRQPDNRITKFSFPSKTIEYMASGTPMIGFQLPGIPREYDPYFFHFCSASPREMADNLTTCLLMSDEDLRMKGCQAQHFILNNKTSFHQVRKILNFLDGKK